MDEWLTKRFEESRSHLKAVAYRMVGSAGEAEDAVQETWLRLNRSDVGSVENLEGWLTTVIARVCLDMLRSRKAKKEESTEASSSELIACETTGADPEHEALLADSVGLALLIVLDKLTPAERIAFVLHDMFDLSFEEISPIVGRSVVATRQLASRARRRVRGGAELSKEALLHKRTVVDAFLAAAREGNFAGLLQVLDPDVIFRADPAVIKIGSAPEIHGAEAVAAAFNGRAQTARTVLINGDVGVSVAPGGKFLLAFTVVIRNDRIVEIDALAEPETIQELTFTEIWDPNWLTSIFALPSLIL